MSYYYYSSLFCIICMLVAQVICMKMMVSLKVISLQTSLIHHSITSMIL